MSKQAWPDKRFCLEEVNLCRGGPSAASPTRIREKLVVGLAARPTLRPVLASCEAKRFTASLSSSAAIFLQAAVWGSERVGDVEVSVQPLPSHENSAGGPYYPVNGNIHGYVEFRVQLKNFSAKEQVCICVIPATNVTVASIAAWSFHERCALPAGRKCRSRCTSHPSRLPTVRWKCGWRECRMVAWFRFRACTNSAGSLTPYNPNPPSPAVLLSRSVPQDFRDRGSTKRRDKVASTSRRCI